MAEDTKENSLLNQAADDIKIMADPTSTSSCNFTVDRPVNPNRSYYFPSKEKAKGSPLAETLFDLEGVSTVLISHEQVTVTKNNPADWRALASQVGATIRSHLGSGELAVSEELWQELPTEQQIRERAQTLLDSEINPAVAAHGGVIALLDVKQNVVYLQMGGGCQGCGMASVTLKQGVEKAIREKIPEVGDILDATDHAAGNSPYYAQQ